MGKKTITGYSYFLLNQESNKLRYLNLTSNENGQSSILISDTIAKPTFSHGYTQWQIQDFPEEALTPKVGVLTYYFGKNCMKMKKFGPRGGASLAPP